MPTEAAKRVFLALPLSLEFKNGLEQTLKNFKQEVWKTRLEPRWLDAACWHLTILPPQNWLDQQIQQAQHILEQELLAPSFKLLAQKIISAPPDQAQRMFWLEFSPLPEFFSLRAEVVRLLDKYQLVADTSPFHTVHLTLAKFPEQTLENPPEEEFVSSFLADKIELWQSTLTPRGAEYSTLAAIPLK